MSRAIPLQKTVREFASGALAITRRRAESLQPRLVETMPAAPILGVELNLGSPRMSNAAPANAVPDGCLSIMELMEMKTFQCVVCGLVYDESKGWPSDGIPPGTRWSDVPADWKCPECGVGKDEFDMVEI